jgi:hypothetical protein
MPEGRQAIDYWQPSILSVRIGSEADIYSAQHSLLCLQKANAVAVSLEGSGFCLPARFCDWGG